MRQHLVQKKKALQAGYAIRGTPNSAPLVPRRAFGQATHDLFGPWPHPILSLVLPWESSCAEGHTIAELPPALSAHIALVIPLHACLFAVSLGEWLSSRLRVSSFFLAHSLCLPAGFASFAHLSLMLIKASAKVGRIVA
jgi:hypothetical protein